ncbi:potassium transporter peripheral membrane component [Streptococcus equi subsp. zooepidemicus]|nr:potassium transporter peripheral membrane component [Streptococcus equi subsp. zooepidemicus]
MDKKILFKALNTELAKENISLTLSVSVVLSLNITICEEHKMSTPFIKKGVNIRQMIKKVGDEFGVNEPDELWLNNSVANLNRIPPKTICETVFHYSNLIVLVPPLSYILGMKLESGRDRDRQDAGDIIKLANIRSPKKLINTLEEYGFQPDISMILEVFEIAYGMEWLANYMSEHPEEFRYY